MINKSIVPTTVSTLSGYKPMTESEAIKLSTDNPVQGLTKTKEGYVKNDIANFEKILREDPYLKDKLKYNDMACRITIADVYWDPEEHPIKDVDITYIRVFISSVYNIDSKTKIESAVGMVANKNAYHPIKDILSKLIWDGKPRLANLFPRYLGAERSELTTALTEMLFFALIQRIRHPGIKFDNCPILVDEEQGTGKSSLCKFLALDDKYFTDSLSCMDDPKKAGELIRGKWICEIGEMIATKKTKDIESIKGFLSRTTDSYRASYGHFAEDYLRQTVFIGTTNKGSACLPDDKTGNRRFYPILCDSKKAEVHPLENASETREYIMQCYAEAMVIGRQKGFPLELDKKFKSEMEEIRDNATPEDTRIGMIQEWLDSAKEEFVCSRMIFYNVFASGTNKEPTRYELIDISEIMNTKIKGWKKYCGVNGKSKNCQYRFPTYGKQRAWQRCDNIDSSTFTDDFDLATKGEAPFAELTSNSDDKA